MDDVKELARVAISMRIACRGGVRVQCAAMHRGRLIAVASWGKYIHVWDSPGVIRLLSPDVTYPLSPMPSVYKFSTMEAAMAKYMSLLSGLKR